MIGLQQNLSPNLDLDQKVNAGCSLAVRKNETGCYTQNPKIVVPGWVLPLFSLGYSGIAVHPYTSIQMWISWTLGLQSIAKICIPTWNRFVLYTPASFFHQPIPKGKCNNNVNSAQYLLGCNVVDNTH